MEYRNTNNFKAFFVILCMVFFCGICFADDSLGVFSSGEEQKSDKPTIITADSMELDMAKDLITLDGNVIVNYPESKIAADKIFVYLKKNDEKEKSEKKKNDDVLGGAGGNQSVDKIVAIGHVVIERIMPEVDGNPQPRQKAVGGHAVYDTREGTIILTEKPMLIYGNGSYVEGTKITLWKDSDRLKVDGNRGTGRLSRLILSPEDQGGLGDNGF